VGPHTVKGGETLEKYTIEMIHPTKEQITHNDAAVINQSRKRLKA
jgi:hypothetical protein